MAAQDRGLVMNNLMRLRIALATLVLQFTFGVVFTWGALVPYVRAQGWPAPVIGAVFSASPLGYGAAAVVGGRMADRFRARRLCWLAFGLLVIGFSVALVVPGPLTMVGFYAFLALGLGGGIAITGSLAAAAHAFPRLRGSAGGMLTGVYALGAVVQLPVVGHLAASLGWVWALRVAGGALVIMSLLALSVMPPLPGGGRANEPPARMAVLVRRPRLLTAILAVACLSPFGTYAFVNAGVFANSAGLARVAVVALIAVAIGNATGRMGAGVLADRLGVDDILLCLGGCEVVSGLLVALGAGAGAAWLVLGCLGAGLGLGGAAGVMARAGADAAPDAPQSGFGLMFGGYAFGALLGPLVGPELGRAPKPWLVLAALGVLAVGLAAVRRTSVWDPASPPQG
jgi:MFS family permease